MQFVFLLLLFCFTTYYSLSYLLDIFKVVITSITVSCNHACVVKCTTLLFLLPFALMKAYCYLAKMSVSL